MTKLMGNYNVEYFLNGKIIKINIFSNVKNIDRYITDKLKGDILLIRKVI